jgi:hypothetical protein
VLRTEEVILFSPLPVEACRRRIEDAILAPHASPIAGRIRSRGIELWRREPSLRLVRPTLVLRLFAADERTRLETRMTIGTSGVFGLGAYLASLASTGTLAALGWMTIALILLAIALAIRTVVHRYGGRALSVDAPYLRDQLGELVHAVEPAR